MIPSLLATPEVSAVATDGVGRLFTTIVTEVEVVLPRVSVSVTVYVVVTEGETTRTFEVEPLFHR